MYIPDYYEFCCRVKIVAGDNALDRVGPLLGSMDVCSPMILTDKGVMEAGLIDKVTRALGKDICVAAIEDEVPLDSDIDVVNRLARAYRAGKCDSIIAVGGGSVMDTAKGINILVSENASDLMQFTGAGALKRPLKPLVAIPTTAGTGSEVTLVAVIADHAKNRKMLFTSYFLQPDIAIIDPEMTLTLPAHITAATAMDAMSHAVEAATMLSRNPLSRTHAVQAIQLIAENLIRVIRNPCDREGRLALATGATLAGIAFSNSMVGMVHALGHSAGSVCHVPHGTCMSILLPYGLEYNYHKIKGHMGDLLFYLAGPEKFISTEESQRPAEVIEWIRQFNRELRALTQGRHATCFRQVKDHEGNLAVPQTRLAEIAETALGDGAIFYNPEDLDYGDFLMVAQAAWEGIPLDMDKIRKG
jgi:alcohol dehydrogenase